LASNELAVAPGMTGNGKLAGPIPTSSRRNTQISDAGLAQLSQLRPNFHSLQGLGLFNTKVTNAGIGALQKARPKVRLIRGLRD
jgi:hypothetical protein